MIPLVAIPSWVWTIVILVALIGGMQIVSDRAKRRAGQPTGGATPYGVGYTLPPSAYAGQDDMTSTIEIARPKSAVRNSLLLFGILGLMMIGMGFLAGGDIASMTRMTIGSFSFTFGPQQILTVIGALFILFAVGTAITGSRWRLIAGSGGLEQISAFGAPKSLSYGEITKVQFVKANQMSFVYIHGPGAKRFASAQTTWQGVDALLVRLQTLRPDLLAANPPMTGGALPPLLNQR